jgi:hypothetical protein
VSDDFGCLSGGSGDEWHITQGSGGCAGCWTNWNKLGGNEGCMQGNPKPYAWPDDRLETFAYQNYPCASSGQAAHTWESCVTCWSGWYDVANNGDMANGPGATLNAANNLEFFSLSGNDQAVYHTWWTGSGWTGAYSLAGQWKDF